MQIPPTSISLAASIAGTTSSNREATVHQPGAPTPAQGVEHLEKSEASGDRDAQERYDGPEGKPKGEQLNQEMETNQDGLLKLEADDQQQPPLLDLRG
jgi:hypothetical protein